MSLSFKKNKYRGFTLIEMLVVLAIFVFVTTIILFNLPDFKSGTNLDLVAQQVSLYIRGAQVYTTGSLRTVRTVGSNTSVDIPSYGMHFVNGNNNFLLFGNIPEADGNVVNYNYLEDSACSGSGECVEKYRLPAGYRFSPSGLKTCTDQQGLSCSPVDSVDIVFKRPETQAYFYCGSGSCPNNTKSVMIEISSIKNNLKRWVRVSQSGQVAVLLTN